MGCPFLRTRNTTVSAPSVVVLTTCHSPRRLIEAGACFEGYFRFVLSFDGHTPFENEAKLSTRVVVLRADRVRGSLDEPHDNFEFVRVGHFPLCL